MSRVRKEERLLIAVSGKDGGFEELFRPIREDPRVKVLEGHRAYDAGSMITKYKPDMIILGSSLKRRELTAISEDFRRVDPGAKLAILLETGSPNSVSYESVLNADTILRWPASPEQLSATCLCLLGLAAKKEVLVV